MRKLTFNYNPLASSGPLQSVRSLNDQISAVALPHHIILFLSFALFTRSYRLSGSPAYSGRVLAVISRGTAFDGEALVSRPSPRSQPCHLLEFTEHGTKRAESNIGSFSGIDAGGQVGRKYQTTGSIIREYPEAAAHSFNDSSLRCS